MSCKGAELDPMLLLNNNRQALYGESNDTMTFDLE